MHEAPEDDPRRTEGDGCMRHRRMIRGVLKEQDEDPEGQLPKDDLPEDSFRRMGCDLTVYKQETIVSFRDFSFFWQEIPEFEENLFSSWKFGKLLSKFVHSIYSISN